jgi:hypothetical protein
LKQPRPSFIPSALLRASLGVVLATASGLTASAQQTQTDSNTDLAESVRELRAQVQELRSAVADVRAEAAQYRAQSEELRNEVETLRAAAGPNPAASGTQPSNGGAVEPRVAALEETTQVVQSEVRTQYQSKVESASKYRVRLSGLVLLNIFGNQGSVDNLDIPTYAAVPGQYGAGSTFGATLRQSELGLEVFGPQLAGAKTSGQLQVDFGGGFPSAAQDGINTGLARMRTADVRMDWKHTSIVAGQDNLFISPNSPTSFASLAIPSFGYSGNLWSWTPQIRIEHRVDLAPDQDLSIQAGVLDNVTGDRSYSSLRQPQAGESGGQPAYAARIGWSGVLGGKPSSVGASGYYSRQNWGNYRKADGWAVATDWHVPLRRRFELSGELYRGRAIGGIGGAIGQTVVFSGDPSDPYSLVRAVNAAGGWSQLKYLATSRLEFNGAFGLDAPFAADIHAFPSPVGAYQNVLAANRSEMFNFVYRPRSDLLLSGEYRHLRTNQVNILNTADQVNLSLGVLF